VHIFKGCWENGRHISDNPFTAFTSEKVPKKPFFSKNREMGQTVTFETEVTSNVLNYHWILYLLV
jgi:hypothetical protein